MMRSIWARTLCVAALFLAAGPAAVQGIAGEEHAYIGAARCKMCHNKAAKGSQYDAWSKSDHAKAFETLGGDLAREIAAERGLDDPQTEDACLKCHVAGHGAPEDRLTSKWNREEGVSCEACHGPGGDYWKMSVMKDRDTAVAAGLAVPDVETCTGCHNEESPTHEGFDFETFWAKIAHPNPQNQ